MGRFPVKEGLGAGGVGDQGGWVSGAAGMVACGYRVVGDRADCGEDLLHAVADPGAQIEGGGLAALQKILQRRGVGVGEVYDVDVVAHRRWRAVDACRGLWCADYRRG